MKSTVALGLVVAGLLAAGGPPSSAQTRRLNAVMRGKLEHSKNVLEGVVTSNWPMLERESQALAAATRDPAWTVLTMPEYVRQSERFIRATEELLVAAKQRDLDAASKGFVALSTSCVACHQYLARSRVAR
jgi:cytochrome c556